MEDKLFKGFVQFLNEADIQKNPAMSPEYFSSLNRRAEHNVQGIERKYGRDMMNLMQYVHQVQAMQRGHEQELEQLAHDVIVDQYGSILGDTQLDIKIPTDDSIQKMMKPPKPEEQDQPEFKEIEDDDVKNAIHKRKILNMTAQGEALNAKKLFTGEVATEGMTKIFGEAQGKQMLDLLIKITDIAIAMDWRMPEEVAQQMWEQGDGFSGASEIKWTPPKADDETENDDEEEGSDEQTEENTVPTIVVRGLDFSMLIHEAIKGIYGLINQGGLAHMSEDDIAKVFMNADTMKDEIQDLKRAKLTTADLRDFMNSFPDVTNMENGREYVWGKMINAEVLPDKEFLELMKLIWTAAPLYRTIAEGDPRPSEAEIAAANEAMPIARQKVQKIIDLIKEELEEWQRSQEPSYMDSYADDTDYQDEEDDTLPGGREPEPEVFHGRADVDLAPSEIQELIDKALDRRDFAEVARLHSLLKESKIRFDDEP